MAKTIDINTDWGAKGAQLTGAEVQTWIKEQIQSLTDKDTTLQNQINTLTTDANNNNPVLRAATDGCFVTYCRKSDNIYLAVPYWSWPALEQSGEVADGVLVVMDGQAPIVVAPTQAPTTLLWSKNAVGVDTTSVGSSYAKAYLDFDGKTKTAAIMAKATELFGDDDPANYAAGFCAAYDRSYKYTKDEQEVTQGKGAGSWWLPSIAELITIWSHKYAINQCLSVISGATQLTDSWYWSSTEYSATDAWFLNLSGGHLGWYAKVSNSGYVRAVSAFH